MINGRDWASYQGAAPDVSGLDFVFIKVTQGLSYTNPYWQQQVHAAVSAGLVVGLYHYPNMHNSASQEAQHFVETCGVLGGQGRMLMLDWEGYDPSNQGLSHADQAAYKDAFLACLQLFAPQNRHVLYANLDYWRNVDTSGKFGDALFIATADLPAGHPGIASPFLFHQYGTSRGVDLDVAMFPSRAALAAWASKQEADMPLTPEDAKTVWGYSHVGGDGHADAPDVHQTLQNAQDQAKAANEGVTALTAKVDALATQVGTLLDQINFAPGSKSALDMDAAAEAGAAAAINKFLASLTVKAS